MSPAQLQSYLHAHIPMSAAMGLRVRQQVGGPRRYEAALASNRNHCDTAFGGSVSTLAILAGWAEVHMGLLVRHFPGRVVIQRNHIEYEAPGTGDLLATAEPPAEAAWERFLRAIDRRGRGRIQMAVSVVSSGIAIASFTGSYVALTD